MRFINLFSSCFKADTLENEARETGAVALPPTVVPGCVFCKVSSANGFDVVYEARPVLSSKTQDIIIFKDRSPAARQHLLVIPRDHLASVKALRQEHIPLVRSLETVGRQALNSLNVAPSDQLLGFHIPPFTSVQHLHLHAQGMPYRNSLEKAKFPVATTRLGKGVSWFVEISQVYDILGKGGRIKVLPC